MSLIEFKYLLISKIKKTQKKLTILFYSLLNCANKIQKNKIVFCVNQGRGVGCNAKYIAKEIVKQKLPCELVWIAYPEFMNSCQEELKDIRFVNYKDKKGILKELSSAKIWVDSTYKINEYKIGLKKKKGQFYLNTWHGSLGIKKMFYDLDVIKFSDSFLKYLNMDIDNWDTLLANCKWEEDVFRGAFKYKGKIDCIGHPRNDIFFEDRMKYKKKIHEYLNIKLDDKLAIYMPSFRDSLNIEYYNLDYELLKKNLEQKFNGNWIIATRFHTTNLKKPEQIMKKRASLYDISYYPDSQEVLMAADVIISDYSSCMFDFLLTKRPCFIFATDIKEYNTERGFYYPLEKTPFPIATNNQEIEDNILNFNYEMYQQKCTEFLKEKSIVDDGNASKRAVEILKKVLNDE